jgi:UDP-glucose 4-epimerase
MAVLLTGGMGFIGSHIAVTLLNNNINVVIYDNLSNSKIEVLDKIKQLTISNLTSSLHFIKGDMNSKTDLEQVFIDHNITAVIHLASLKAVGESIKLPLYYYKNNINGMISLLETMERYSCNKLIFSSSATVYGSNNISPINEDSTIGTNITNPYGQTKYFQEQILQDYVKANNNFSCTILRYFNPVGAHPSGLIGEDPNGIPNNLFPYILRVASGQYKELNIFGNTYDTPDGTCVRDFIHVMDLAEGHMITLKETNPGIMIYNLGSGKGTSVMELVNTFERVNNIKIPYIIQDKRDGDIDILYADASKIYNTLGWKTQYTIEDICRDGRITYLKF